MKSCKCYANEVLTLDGDFAEKLKQVLSDPEAMSKITAIASSFGGGTPTGPSPESTKVNAEPEQISSVPESANLGQPDALPALMQGFGAKSDPRLLLLSSIKPLLREEKREKIDAITKALAIASMMKNLRK